MTAPLRLGIALKDAGWHPGAWREPSATPDRLFTGGYWVALARTAEDAGIDLLTIEDTFGLQTADAFGGLDLAETRGVRGRFDAVLLADFIAPLTSRIGLVPTVSTALTEPFHVATAIATLDFASRGRAGVRPVAAARPHEAANLGRWAEPFRPEDLASPEGPAIIADRFGEAADAIEVLRRLWDSWQDDAVIRDVATGRYLDRDRLHHSDFVGSRFSVKGPSIVPRPPQGQPVVTLLAHQRVPYLLAAAQGDVVFVTPHDDADVIRILGELRAAERDVDRTGTPLQVWADAVVLVTDAPGELDRLDAAGGPIESDAVLLAGSADEIAERLQHWHELGIEGFRLRPARLPLDLDRVADGVVPALGLEASTGATDLRSRLGLPPAPNRFTHVPAFAARDPFAATEETTAR
ncbi:LLM class flavin-dependent oxidoreductase [uncultured Amnibacterium sp.]|uniref:LLM class flavin-dependent oxidoreductase n=1 Tax=uncultured Amnibacterium sp. TaxID=1631851 RepID=UPI0035CBC47A